MRLHSNTRFKVSTQIKCALSSAVAALLCIAPAQAAVVSWDGTNTDITSLTGNQNATGANWAAADTVWNTSDMAMAAVGDQAALKLAISQVAHTHKTAQINHVANALFVGGGGSASQGKTDITAGFSVIYGFDTGVFNATDTLTNMSVTLHERTASDVTSFRWFVESGGTTYVSASVASDVGGTLTTYTLADPASETWYAFDGSLNLESAVGVSLGTLTLTDVNYAGIMSTVDTITDANQNWRGTYVDAFSVEVSNPIVQTNATYADITGAAAVTSATDLANQGQATFASSTVTANKSGETPEESFNDGVTAASFDNMTWFLDGDGHFPATVTLNLDVSSNTAGYNITEINSIAGWAGGAIQAHQVMTVEYSVVGDAGYTTLGTYSNETSIAGEFSSISLTEVSAGYLATGVDALRFTYADPAGADRLVLQEIDVIGVAAEIPLVATNYTYTLLADVQDVTSATDLADSSQATSAGATVSTNQGGDTDSTGDVIDGVASTSLDNATWFHNGNGHLPAEVVLNLDVTTYSNGYNISEINSIAGWYSAEQADQILTIEYSVVGSATWTQLGAGAFTNTDAGADEYSRIHLAAGAGNLATGVDALRFTYAATGNNLLLQEIDVIGDPVPVPLDLELSSMFSDDMILQREKAVPVWGTSAPGVGITVEFAGQTKTTTAAGDGTWTVNLDSMVASTTSRDLTVTADLGSDTEVVTFSNVLVGEVWLCSGQSNMAFTIAQTLQKAAVEATPNNSTLRFFKVPQVTQGTPLERLDTVWTESTTGSSGTARDFGAVAYHFGLMLQDELESSEGAKDVPVGLIHSAKGGTTVEKWLPSGTSYNTGDAGGHYNGQIDAIIPFAMRGAIWYQGESNVAEDQDATGYVAKKKALIDGWRALWGYDFPFYYAQLAPYDYTTGFSVDAGVLPLFWEAQSAVLDQVTNAGMAVASDHVVGTDGNLNLNEMHPRDKEPIGQRLALLALDNTYGQSIVSTGPTLQSIRLVGNQVEITFDSAVGLTTSDSNAPDWFELAGADQTYYTATATVSGDKVILEASQVPVPEYMRFAWSQVAQPNLRNAVGLVPSAFRADVPVAAWSTWLGDNSLTGNDALPTGNVDGDSLNNLLEFAFGTDPAVSDGGSIAYGSGVTPGLPLAVVETVTATTVDFRAAFGRRKDWAAAGLTYTVQFSSDLTEWVDSADTPLEIESGSGDIDAVYVPYPLAIPTSNGYEKAQFFRLSISQN